MWYLDFVVCWSTAGRWSSIGLTHKKWMYIALGLFYGNSSLVCFHFRTWQQYRLHLQLSTKMFVQSYPTIAYLFSVTSWQDAGIPTLMSGHHLLKLWECLRMQRMRSWQQFGRLGSGVAWPIQWLLTDLILCESKCKKVIKT